MHDEAPAVTAERVKTTVMCALDLALDVAYHDGTPRDLAVAAEAYSLAGFHDGAIMISHAGGTAVLARVQDARRGRPARLLRADARGMLRAVTIMAEAGLITDRSCAEATRLRWVARGGHDRKYESRPQGLTG